MQANTAKNYILAEQYTSVEDWHNQNWDKNGKKTDDESAEYENVFVEGLPYRRKVKEDGKPLTGKAAAEEEQRYEKAVAERKNMSMDEKRGFFHHTSHFDLPLCCLTTLFDNRVTGMETIDGRKAYVVESTAKPDAKPADRLEKTALGWKETTWIDVEDEMPVRLDAVALKNIATARKGMTMRLDFERLLPPADDKSGNPVWLEKDFSAKGWGKILYFDRRLETEDSLSNYKKFHVDVRLLPDSVKMTTAGSGEEHP